MLLAAAVLAHAVAVVVPALAGGEDPPPSPREQMTARGFVRYRGSWRTVQEIGLIERNEKASLAQKEWVRRLERLRKDVDRPATADRAAEEIREISDPFAVPALGAAIAKEAVPTVRGWYVEALARIGSADATRTLVAIALDHPDPETRIAAVERLEKIGPQLAVPTLTAALFINLFMSLLNLFGGRKD